MQKTLYVCDQCHETIGNQRHFSLNFGRFSGVANPPNSVPAEDPLDYYYQHETWSIKPKLENKFIHLHRNCVLKFFSALMTEKPKEKELIPKRRLFNRKEK